MLRHPAVCHVCSACQCGDAMGGQCFCFACAASCHSGHDITKVGAAPLFCDCGFAHQTCLMMKSTAERKALKAKSAVTAEHAVQDEPSTADLDEEAEHPCKEISKEVRTDMHTRTQNRHRYARRMCDGLVRIRLTLLAPCVVSCLSVSLVASAGPIQTFRTTTRLSSVVPR